MEAMWAILILTTILAFLVPDAEGAEFGGFVGAEQSGNDLQTVQVGLTVEWKHVAIDISHGVQRPQWRVQAEPEWQMDEWQSGSTLGVRVYPFNTETIRPLLAWSHVSDLIRGRPRNDENEPTSDYFGAGITVVIKRFEFDVMYGSLGRECRVTKCHSDSRTNEFKIGFRGYFWK